MEEGRIMERLKVHSILFLAVITSAAIIQGCGGGSSPSGDTPPPEDNASQNDSSGDNSNDNQGNDSQTVINCNDIDTNSVIRFNPGTQVSTNQEVVMDARAYESYADATFNWDYGDGTYSLNQAGSDVWGAVATTHFYALPGVYTVRLTVNDTQVYTCPITVNGEALKVAPQLYTLPLIALDFDQQDITNNGSANLTIDLMDTNGVKAPESSDFVNGIYGNAIDLSTGNYIAINEIASIADGLDQFTISFWLKKKSSDALSHLTATQRTYLFSQLRDGMSIPIIYSRIENDAIGFGMSTSNGDNLAGGTISTNYAALSHYWQHVAMTWDGTSFKTYVDGQLISTNEGSGNLELDSGALFIGVKDSISTEYVTDSRDIHFNGYMDEFEMYDQALTQEEIFVGFELWHSDLHAHTTQPIQVKIPSQYTADASNQISATLVSGNSSWHLSLDNPNDAITIIGRSNNHSLSSTETIRLNYAVLPASDEEYILTVNILDSGGDLLEQRTTTFEKDYSGAPAVGINEHNGIEVNQAPYFPVTCFGLHDHSQYETLQMLTNWSANGVDKGGGERWERPVINTGFAHGWNIDYSANLYSTYLDDILTNNLLAIGPTTWSGINPTYDNSDIDELVYYVNSNKEKAGVLMWSWMDEPDLHSVSAETVRAWTALSHINDKQHPVATTLRGRSFISDNSDYFISVIQSYMAQYNAIRFGRLSQPLNGVYVTDVIGFDYYPIDWAEPHRFDATIVETINALDNAHLFSRDTVPHYDFVETTDIYEPPYNTPYDPTPPQLKMLSWIHIVHKMKLLPWFHHHTQTPDENFIVMADVLEAIEHFTPALNSGDSDYSVQTTIDTSGINSWNLGSSYSEGTLVSHAGNTYVSRQSHTSSEESEPINDDLVLTWKQWWKTESRIDVLVKEDSENIYIFAVRPTEIDINGNSIGAVRDISFNLSGSFADANIEVWNESRTVTMIDNTFVDRFEPNDVHVYVIPK